MSFSYGKQMDMEIVGQTQGFNVSEKYVPVPTKEAIDILAKEAGFISVGFDAANVRKPEKRGFQKHLVMLEEPEAKMTDGSLRVVLYNSYDRSASLRLYLGYYRDACSNDCVFGDDIMEPIVMKHTKQDWKTGIYQLLEEYENHKRNVEETIDRLMGRYMSYGDQGRLCERVAESIFDGTGTIIDPLQLNVAHRIEDVGKNAWLTYQRIQYNLLNGGVERVVPDKNGINKISHTHKVTDVNKKILINRKLYDLVEEIA